MITLNKEHGLVNVDSWEAVITSAGYLSELNPSEHTLDSIIGRYVEKDMVKCGLTNCRSPHSKGYLVKTKSGYSTNIGQDCGKKYFGVDFETMAKQFDRDITMQTNRNLLASFSFQIDELENTIANFRQGERGADWIYKKTRPLVTVNSGCPNEIVRLINGMVKSSNYILSKPREATKKEIDTAETAKGGKVQLPYFIDEPVAEISGVQVLRAENDIRALFVLDFETNLIAFKKLNVDLLDYEQLRHWSKWVNGLENKLELAVNIIKAGNELLTRSNLQPFNEIISTREDKELLRKYLNTLD